MGAYAAVVYLLVKPDVQPRVRFVADKTREQTLSIAADTNHSPFRAAFSPATGQVNFICLQYTEPFDRT